MFNLLFGRAGYRLQYFGVGSTQFFRLYWKTVLLFCRVCHLLFPAVGILLDECAEFRFVAELSVSLNSIQKNRAEENTTFFSLSNHLQINKLLSPVHRVQAIHFIHSVWFWLPMPTDGYNVHIGFYWVSSATFAARTRSWELLFERYKKHLFKSKFKSNSESI